jgi:hypothetical protein
MARVIAVSVLVAGAIISALSIGDYCEQTIEEAARQEDEETLVAFMSIETMFPDEWVRELAEVAAAGHLGEVDRLVAEGVGVNARGNQGATPLLWSMRNLQGFQKLLSLGADANAVFGDGSSVLHWAATGKNPAFLELALRHGGNPNLVAGTRGETPLFRAVGAQRKAIELLLSAGADVNARSSEGDIAGCGSRIEDFRPDELAVSSCQEIHQHEVLEVWSVGRCAREVEREPGVAQVELRRLDQASRSVHRVRRQTHDRLNSSRG